MGPQAGLYRTFRVSAWPPEASCPRPATTVDAPWSLCARFFGSGRSGWRVRHRQTNRQTPPALHTPTRTKPRLALPVRYVMRREVSRTCNIVFLPSSLPLPFYGGGGFSAVWDPASGTDFRAHANVGATPLAGIVRRSPTSAMDDAQKALDAAVARRTQIAELLVVTRAAVDEDRRNNLRRRHGRTRPQL